MSERKRDESQSERFERAARELGVEIDEEKLKEALRWMGKQDKRDGADEGSPSDGTGR